MKIKKFRKTYPQYDDLSNAELTSKVNTKYPGTIDTPKEEVTIGKPTLKPKEKRVGKYDPRRLLPQYAHEREKLKASDIARAGGAKQFYEKELPKSEARERVSIVLEPNDVVNKIREKFPQYSDLNDVELMEKITLKYPQYGDVLLNIYKDAESKYKMIDKIEHKKSIGATLSPKEAFVNLMAIPKSGEEYLEQTVPNFVNNVTFGLQDHILRKIGYNRPKPETGLQGVAAGASSLAGFLSAPLPAAKGLLKIMPGVKNLWVPIKASSKAQRILKPLLRTGFELGTAGGLMIPKGGLVDPEGRIGEFGSGFMFGTVLGGVGFVPNKFARMTTSSLVMGVPSTLTEASWEEQVFNYGLGAYMGIHSVRDVVKREGKLRKVIDHGVTNKKKQGQLFESSRNLMKELIHFARSYEGKKYQKIWNVGLKRYNPALYGPWRKTDIRRQTKKWRGQTIKGIKSRLKELKNEKGFGLRNDKISRTFQQLKGKRLSSFTNAQLYNLQTHLKPQYTPPVDVGIFKAKPPSRPEMKTGKKITLYQRTLRLGLKQLEKLGFGKITGSSLTADVWKSDVKRAQFELLHRAITNRWKGIVGVNKRTSKMLFRALNREVDLRKISKRHPRYKKHQRVANEMKRYFKVLLDIQNRHRAKYGEELVKPRKNYITHVMSAFKKMALERKYPFPQHAEDVDQFIPPTKREQPYLKRRKGAVGYVENAWTALDSYAYKVGDYISDDGLRHTNRIIKFLKREKKINDKTGKLSPVNLQGIIDNLTSWGRRYAGRPGKIDKFISDSVKALPGGLSKYANSLPKLTGLYRTLIYTGYMGWRPKLALRNLGQHSLIIGEVGPKYLWRAVKSRNKPEMRKLLKESKVLKTREMGFAPEIPHGLTRGALEKTRRSAFWAFRKADRVNVEDAFLSGYLEGKSKGWSRKRSIKRGDQVAALTQYIYTKANRGPISDLWGLSSNLGKVASMFTTWPINKLELMMGWSKAGNRKKLARYTALVGLAALGGQIFTKGKVRTTAYTGFGAEMQLLRKIQDGIVSTRGLPLKPDILLRKDVQKGLDEELWRMIIYDVRENTPLWQKF